MRTNLSAIWANSGAHEQLAVECSEWLAEARDRNDRFALTMLEAVGMGGVRHLMRDDTAEASAALDAALAPWPLEPFSFAHLGELISRSFIELYRGGEGTSAWFEREHARLSRAFMLQRGLGRATLLMFRGYGSLAAWVVARGERARVLLASAARDMHELKRVKSKLGAINALAIEAQLLAIEGQTERALASAHQVRERCDACGFVLLARSVEHLQGRIEAGDSGRLKRESALQFFAGQGWSKPERAVAVLCPVSDALPRWR